MKIWGSPKKRLKVSNENLGVSNENLGVSNENLEVSNETSMIKLQRNADNYVDMNLYLWKIFSAKINK